MPMAEASERSADQGQQLRRPFAWINWPLHFEWSCANLAWLAVAMLPFGDHLLYYSAEIKQYSCDLMLALIAMLLAAPGPSARMSPRQFMALGVFGLIAPWFSFPVVFVLAGVGVHLIVTEAMRKDYRRAGLAVGMSLLWLLSFGACFLLSRSILSKRDFIWVWWNFAFLPLPPRSPAD